MSNSYSTAVLRTPSDPYVVGLNNTAAGFFLLISFPTLSVLVECPQCIPPVAVLPRAELAH